MKLSRTLIAIAAISTLGATLAVAGTTVLNGQYPDEVKSSSIKLPRSNAEDQASLQALSKISQAEAEATALVAAPGATLQKTKLDDEDDYLVWKVDVMHNNQGIELAIDPGTGKVLAAEAEDNDDNDDDKQEHNEREQR